MNCSKMIALSLALSLSTLTVNAQQQGLACVPGKVVWTCTVQCDSGQLPPGARRGIAEACTVTQCGCAPVIQPSVAPSLASRASFEASEMIVVVWSVDRLIDDYDVAREASPRPR